MTGNEDAFDINISILGSWTTYLKRSCRPKADFMMYTRGMSILRCITERDKPNELGKEIMINYGRVCFVHQRLA